MGRMSRENFSVLDTQNVFPSSDQEMHCLCVSSSSLHIWYNDGRNRRVLDPSVLPDDLRGFVAMDGVALSDESDARMAARTMAAWSGSASCSNQQRELTSEHQQPATAESVSQTEPPIFND